MSTSEDGASVVRGPLLVADDGAGEGSHRDRSWWWWWWAAGAAARAARRRRLGGLVGLLGRGVVGLLLLLLRADAEDARLEAGLAERLGQAHHVHLPHHRQRPLVAVHRHRLHPCHRRRRRRPTSSDIQTTRAANAALVLHCS